MANGPPCMNKNMAPNPTGATLFLCSPSVISVETGTATNIGTLPTVNPSWGSVLANTPKVMDSCYTSQPQKNDWSQKTTAWTRLYHMVPYFFIPIMEGLVSTYIIPPPMPPVPRHMKRNNRYTSKQNKCKNIRRGKYSSTPGTTLNPSQFKRVRSIPTPFNWQIRIIEKNVS